MTFKSRRKWTWSKATNSRLSLLDLEEEKEQQNAYETNPGTPVRSPRYSEAQSLENVNLEDMQTIKVFESWSAN